MDAILENYSPERAMIRAGCFDRTEFLIATNWFLYIWAAISSRIIEISFDII
ncbi:MAG: hypothetical protein WB696_12005 [Chthoniobacterales bacterium]|jgi:EamA domain-containing membrane protein RarD